MGDYKQQARKMRVTVDGLGENDLLLKGFTGTETVSRLFRYELEMIAENRQKIAFDQVLGKKATIHLRLPDESSETHINGLVVEFAQGGRDDTFTTYRAELVPEAWRLTRKTQSRIFQAMTVPEILKETLKGFPVKWDLDETYEDRDYCAQYRESDFDFASRLMEEEGIWYFFSHSDGSHEMVVGDSQSEFVDLKGETNLVYEELEGGVREDNRIWAWQKAQRMRAGKSLLWDHCFELPHRHLEAEQQTVESITAGKDTHQLTVPGVSDMELYDWPGGYAQRFDGVTRSGGEQQDDLQKIFTDNIRTVEIRMDAETTPAVTIRGKSNAKHLVPGHKFTLKRHFGGGDGEYLLVSVRHEGVFAGDYRSGKARLEYENSFTCIPASVTFRPERLTSRPHVRGSQTAVVVGPSGEEIFTDKYGRVKVQFHWDRDEPRNADSSCWVRVATSWAGRQWGTIHIPRIGHEVVVDFLEGDPDQPIIVGSVYNADMMPPYTLPDNKTQSGIKSRSSMNGGPSNYNEFRFEDKKGKEQVLLHAEKNLSTSVENDESRSVGHDRSTTIGHDDSLHVQHDETINVDNDRREVVGGNETVQIRGNRSHVVGKDDSLVVSGGVGRKVLVEKGDDVLQLDKGSQIVGIRQGNRQVSIDQGNDTLVVGAGNRTTSIPQGELFVKAKTIRYDASEKITFHCGASTIEMTTSSITVSSTQTSVEATAQATVKGATTTVRGTSTVSVQGGTTATLQATLVKINC